MLPRITVTDAAGSEKEVAESAFTVEEKIGPSGSAVPPVREGCHTYWALPKVFSVTGPEKELAPEAEALAKEMRTACAFSWSLLITSSDQAPSGRAAA